MYWATVSILGLNSWAMYLILSNIFFKFLFCHRISHCALHCAVTHTCNGALIQFAEGVFFSCPLEPTVTSSYKRQWAWNWYWEGWEQSHLCHLWYHQPITIQTPCASACHLYYSTHYCSRIILRREGTSLGGAKMWKLAADFLNSYQIHAVNSEEAELIQNLNKSYHN